MTFVFDFVMTHSKVLIELTYNSPLYNKYFHHGKSNLALRPVAENIDNIVNMSRAMPYRQLANKSYKIFFFLVNKRLLIIWKYNFLFTDL